VSNFCVFLIKYCVIICLQSLLTHVSRATKNTLNRLGVFTVSSFHAFICARSPSLLNNLLAGRGATKRRTPMLSRSNSGSSRRSLQLGGSGSRDESNKAAKVLLPEGQVRLNIFNHL
jgi:T-lymphoma invasion and metastasis-inducing protein 1